MKKIEIEFKEDNQSENIRVVFHAKEMNDEVRALMKRLETPFNDTLMVQDEKGETVVLPKADIISVSADNRKLKVVAEEGIFELHTPLRDMQYQLDDADFLKISRYEIINLHKVKRFDFSVSGSLKITMKNDLETWASRRFIADIRDRLTGRRRADNDQ